jgi:hypothetical protein
MGKEGLPGMGRGGGYVGQRLRDLLILFELPHKLVVVRADWRVTNCAGLMQIIN